MKAITAAVAGAFVAASVVGGISSAVGTQTTFYACVHRTAGSIKMTTATKACPTNYDKISWNNAGPQGLKGDTGATGPQGVAGPQGATGPQGVAGPQGQNGSKTVSGVIDLINGVVNRRGAGFDASCWSSLPYETTCSVTFPPGTWGQSNPIVWAGLLAANPPGNPPAYPSQGQVGVVVQSPTSVLLHTSTALTSAQTIQFTATEITQTAPLTPQTSLSIWGFVYGPGGAFSKPNVPVTVDLATDWASIAVGRTVSCGIKTDSTLWCWGENTYGQLGVGLSSAPVATPTQVAGQDWTSVSTDSLLTCGTKADHSLWCWGLNFDGVTFGTMVTAPRRVDSSTDWNVVVWGGSQYDARSQCALKLDHTLWCLNSGVMGPATQFGTEHNWQMVSGSSTFGCGIQLDKSLWCWGNNFYGQVGDGTTTTRSAPVQIEPGRQWLTVATGPWHRCAIASDDSLWCWGQGVRGSLGDGLGVDHWVPTKVDTTSWQDVSVGNGNTCGIRKDSTLWCWGYNSEGRLGVGSLLPSFTTPIRVGSASNWKAVVVNEQTTLGLQQLWP